MIDWDRVVELREEVGADAFDEVVELFLEEVENGLSELPAISDGAALSDALHFLKGSALNLGFTDFTKLCRQDEERDVAKGAAAVDLVAISDCYNRSKERFRAYAGTVGNAA